MARIRYLFVFIIVLISACSTTKYLAPGQKLYNGAQIKITDKNTSKSEAHAITEELEDLLRPKPNNKILGLRFKLYEYEKNKTNKKKGLKHFLMTKLGEPPVLLSSVDIVKNAGILQNRLQNEGYFLAQVSGDTASKKDHKIAEVIYSIQTGPAYHYRKITFPTENDDLDTAITGTSKQTYLKVGDKFNLDVIKNERIRIDARLKEEGFFYFAPEDLIMRYDSTIAGHQVDLFVKVKGETPDEARWIYSVRNIYVYPDYKLRDTALKMDSAVKYRWYNVIDPKKTFRPFTFKNSVLLHPGDIYNRTEHTNSLSRFIELGPFKFVKNRFEDVTPDSAKLDIYYFLTQQRRKSLQADIVARQTSANYNGTQIDVNFRNRNLFKGAELFTLKFFASQDIQFGSYNNGYNVYQYGVEPSISWPRFVGPFNFNSDNAYIPRTVLSAGYTIVNRSKLYSLNSYNASFGYQWKPNAHVQHQLDLEDVTYVNPRNVTKTYTDSIQKTRNPTLAHVINAQFTFGPSYSYTWTNTMETNKPNTLYYNGKASLSGNIYGLLTGADTPRRVSKLLGTTFNQYVKLENEIRFYHKLGLNSKLAARFMLDVGLAYGNSTVLPYSQQFFIGGSNSLRGFQAHSIGPGAYILPPALATGTGFLPDESGDIKIEANIEYRPKLFSIVEGALFIDAGNIWLLNSNKFLPGAAFGKSFLSQIAADAGVGLRFNFNVLVLRTDLGFPFLEPNPAIPVHFGQHGVFNLGIGYPF
ncbi:translocation and assembly module lipoprotein TamL [Mucilaginibacter gotjawali]|uniref:Outer membrane protein assembly factor YaeT n=2 Tax=Mucilaginibacter gotjawali TaxID=1550579 RepID=A0A0X8X437_9SPHI|nr:BamA/TamA family outer membrane protein [Mucilaginibacter gotjawali]MBB3057529.1 outer membrane protein assembly factor BamA [Mucilaginibacter gotjawali]BAU55350.1 outer membrane protein assembly factor YaeT [Mucilaginibacter gotjawali]